MRLTRKDADTRRERVRRIGKEPLSDRFLRKTAPLALAIGLPLAGGACTFDSSGVPMVDARQADASAEMRPDKGRDSTGDVTVDVKLSDRGMDIAPDQGRDIAADIGFEGIADLGIDSKADMGMDVKADTVVPDSAVDSTNPGCPGTFIAKVTAGTFNKGVAVKVGGYAVTYTGMTGPGGTVDIKCETGSGIVQLGVAVPLNTAQFIMTKENLRIRLYMYSRDAASATMTVSVENP
jgi:hypothetical protein